MAKGFGQFAQMQEALKKAKQVQQNATRLQDELAETTVEGSAAGGLIKITMTGNQEPLSLSIDPEALKEEREVLEDLILTAFKDAYTRSTDMMRNKMNELTGGISVPGLF
ncbi:YbaB/EbfC family nucleoid-associated protein [Anthocerotibacter panamensis]|uniref:YbaB/EbfC family nucleoid-associated protein n=1 Tax=Anthocerotibacter panamensis TaxID=2857077 RepID=UPI001C4081EA|nr:YbaB/EbfC family nucleoid-associated protein [Anthocerotibacter panamensis]